LALDHGQAIARIRQKVGVAFDIECLYDAQGMLTFAHRCHNDGAPFCGQRCISSAWVGSDDGGAPQICNAYDLASRCDK
jgi:hypothetical protein